MHFYFGGGWLFRLTCGRQLSHISVPNLVSQISHMSYNNDMNHEGVIIEESLRDEGALRDSIILSTKVEKVTSRHNTSWLERCASYLEVPVGKADEAAEAISRSLRAGHWYVDYKNNHTHYIVFPDKILRLTEVSSSNTRLLPSMA
jgi:hypothetical protein